MTLAMDFDIVRARLEAEGCSSALEALARIRGRLEKELHRERYVEAQKRAETDPGRVCDYCGRKGGQHYVSCNTETDGAPFRWRTEVLEWGQK